MPLEDTPQNNFLSLDLGDNAHGKESKVIYNYIYSRSGISFKLSEGMKERYSKAIKRSGLHQPISSCVLRFPFLLGPLDFATRLFYPNSGLQKRIQIGATLVECDTQSAQWLLPKERTRIRLFLKIFILIVSAGLKFALSLFLLIIPGFIKKHAR